MTEAKALGMNPLTLAFVGDGVYTLFVRTYAVEHFDLKANKMDAFCRQYVRAEAQAAAFRALGGVLTDTEIGIALRARNSHPGNKAKNATLADYMHATAFEAVVGFLYVTKQDGRMNEIMELGMTAAEERIAEHAAIKAAGIKITDGETGGQH